MYLNDKFGKIFLLLKNLNIKCQKFKNISIKLKIKIYQNYIFI